MPIHSSAIIDPRAEIHPSADIGAYVILDGPARIGADCRLAPHVVVLGATELGAGCRVHAHAVIGDVPQDRAFDGSRSSVVIGEECIIREGATVHRGTEPGSVTSIGSRCFLMTNTHVGHNCALGEGVTLISGALLGGYVEVGPDAVISGNAAVHQFVRIGELAMIGGLSKVVQDIPPFCMADRNGAILGVNRVGLFRKGFAPLERTELKNAFRILYRSGLGRSDALQMLRASVITGPGQRLLEFLSAKSRRGLSGDASREAKPKPEDAEDANPLRAVAETGE